jgi:hypothetical protein
VAGGHNRRQSRVVKTKVISRVVAAFIMRSRYVSPAHQAQEGRYGAPLLEQGLLVFEQPVVTAIQLVAFGQPEVFAERPDCVLVVIALVVTPEGLPLAYEGLPGNTADNTTLRDFPARIERQYGKARRIWLMDRGIPTEVVLAEMRGSDPGPLPRHAQGPPDPIGEGPPREALAAGPAGGPGQALAARRRTLRFRRQRQPRRQEPAPEKAGERAMRRRQLKWLWARLKQLSMMALSREQLLMKLGAARAHAPAA